MNMMDSIGSLLRTHEASANDAVHSRVMNNLRLLASITPFQSDSMKEVLKTVITDIEANVETKITADLEGTRNAIAETINQLKVATTTAGEDKTKADNADNNWFNCIREEKAFRQEIEEADAATKNSRSNEGVPCQQQQDLAAFQASPQLENFDCDFSTGDCDGQLTNYRTQVTSMLSGLKDELSNKQADYDVAKTACQQAVDDTTAQSSAHDEKIVEWNSKQTECQSIHTSRLLTMCNFGTALQRKCMTAAAYTNLIEEVERVDGGGHSQPDREQEWKTTQLTKCMLKEVMGGGSIDANTLKTCDTDASSVGDLDKMQDDFAATAEKFTCSEETITFGDRTWTVPEGEAPSASDYTYTTPYAVEVDLRENSRAFSFCGGKPGKQ